MVKSLSRQRARSLCFLWAILLPASGSCAVLVLKNGRTYKGSVTRHDSKNYLLPGGKVFVPAQDVAWFSKSNDTDRVIREWWEGIRKRADLEDAVLPLARFCLQEGRTKRGLLFAEKWCRFRPGWRAFLSKEFLFLTDMRPGRAEKTARRMDAALALLRREFPGADKRPYTCVVRFFKKEEEFLKIAEELPYKPESSYYYPRQRMIYLVNDQEDSPQYTYWDAYRVVCYHFLIDSYLQYNPSYTWILAGTAMCFENARSRGGRLEGAWRKHREYAQKIRAAMKGKTYVPLESFLRMKADRFAMGDPYKNHPAQAWSLVYFFKKTKKKAYREAFFRYLKTLKREKDDEKALKAAFLPLGWKRLERDWKAFFGVRR